MVQIHRARSGVVTLVALLAAGLVAVAPPAAAGCAAQTKTLSGTVQGEDGRFVIAMLGIDLQDAAGNEIRADGCPQTAVEYEIITRVNLDSTLTGEGADSGQGLTKSWSVQVPSNAAQAFVEVYPLTYRPIGLGKLDHTRYGKASRHRLPITGGIDMRLPLNCGISHNGVVGSNGTIVGITTVDGVPVQADHVFAWGRLPDSQPGIAGFSIGTTGADGSYELDLAESGQAYTVMAIVQGSTYIRISPTLQDCATLSFDLHFGDPPPPPATFFLSNTFVGGPADITTELGHTGDTPLAGDWDGDGHDDIGTRSGNRYLVRYGVHHADETDEFGYGRSADEVYVGDWDGDDVSTMAVRRGNAYYIKNDVSGGIADVVMAYGRSTDEVLVGDWDGDGEDTFGVRRGNVYFLKNDTRSGIADQVLAYGRSTDEVLVGDWDGDGKDTLAVRRGNTFYLRNDLRSGIAEIEFNFGRAGDTVLVGDWDGNGEDTFGVHR